MQKTLLAILFLNQTFKASEPARQTHRQFILEHLQRSQAIVSWWEKSFDWRIAILKADSIIKTKGVGTVFELCNRNNENIVINFEIDSKLAIGSTLFKNMSLGSNLQSDPEDPSTKYGYLFKKNCITTEFCLSGTSSWPLTDFINLIQSPAE